MEHGARLVVLVMTAVKRPVHQILADLKGACRSYRLAGDRVEAARRALEGEVAHFQNVAKYRANLRLELDAAVDAEVDAAINAEVRVRAEVGL